MKDVILFSTQKSAIDYIVSTLKPLTTTTLVRSPNELYKAIGEIDNSIILFHISFQSGRDEIFEQLLSYLQKTSLFVISDQPDIHEGYSLLEYNIKGYANTFMDSVHYKQALTLISEGNVWFYPDMMNYIIQQSLTQQTLPNEALLSQLSSREQEVAQLVAKGLQNKEIAQQCDITERTVKAHLSSCFEKLGVKDRLALALKLRT